MTSKPAAASKTTSASKTSGGPKTASTSKPGPTSKPATATKTASTAKPGATTQPGTEAHGATQNHATANNAAGNEGLTSTDKGHEGGSSGLLGGSNSKPAAGNRGAGAAPGERKTPERTAPEASARETHAAENHEEDNRARENRAAENHAPESHAAENRAGENHAEGARSVTRPNGDRAEYSSAGKPTRLTTKSGDEARFDSRGQVRAIHTHDTTIRLGPSGGRTVVTERADHTRIVSVGSQYGYVDHPIVRNGRPYLERTYVTGGKVYARAYPGYYYHGAIYYHYAPAYYYAPAFYAWTVQRWPAPITCVWNWGPWHGYYGYYFTPYPTYADASLWLTDYVIAQELKASYEAQQQAPPVAQPIPAASGESADGTGGAAAPLTPETKQAIADEITEQLNAEKNSTPNALTPMNGTAPSGDVVPDALNPSERTFVADITLDAAAPDGSACAVGAGDVVTRVDTAPDADQKIKVSVRSSKRGDCAAGTRVSVSVQDLQDMANHLHEKVDDGVGQLAKSGGQQGLPTGPAASPVPVADSVAKPDLDAQRLLQQQQHTADQTQKNMQQSVNQLGATSSRFDAGEPSAALTIEDGGGLRLAGFVSVSTDDTAFVSASFRERLCALLEISTE